MITNGVAGLSWIFVLSKERERGQVKERERETLRNT
jgi:Tfp pilus assembly protein PilO